MEMNRREFLRNASVVGVTAALAPTATIALAEDAAQGGQSGSSAGSAAGSVSGSAQGSSTGSAVASGSGSGAGSAAGNGSGKGSGAGSTAGSEEPADGTYGSLIGGALCPEDWLGEMPTVTDDMISQSYDFDVVVLGGGHAGAQGALAASQAGAKVACVEKQEQDSFASFGNDIAVYNSQFAIDHGFGPYNLAEITAEYVKRGNGRVNVDVIAQYVENGAEMFDNMVSICPDTSNMFEDGQFVIQHAYDKASGEDYPIEISGYKSWATTFQTGDTINPKPVCGREGVSRMTEWDLYALAEAQNQGAQMFWGTSAYALVVEDDAVKAAIVQDGDGNLIRLNASKGVLLATGDFSGNADMVFNLLDEVSEWGARADTSRARMAGFGRDGMGHKLGCWAGGAMEPHPRPTMDGKVPGAWHTTPTLWINSNGDRFMDEGMTQIINNAYLRQPVGNIAMITDSKFMQSIEAVGVDHGAPNWGNPSQIARMKRDMLAIEPGPDGGTVVATDVVELVNDYDDDTQDFGGNTVWAANSLDELMDYLGFEGDAKDNALATIAHYNELCAAGLDSDYNKDARFLIPIDEPPFYGCLDDNKKQTRAGLVCLAGLSTDKNLNVLKADRTGTIKGLYAAGNCLGERYGAGYAMPSAGNSIGMALTHGYVAGKILAAL